MTIECYVELGCINGTDTLGDGCNAGNFGQHCRFCTRDGEGRALSDSYTSYFARTKRRLRFLFVHPLQIRH